MNEMKILPKIIAILIIVGFYACASTGTPDGGPYDEDPPKFVRSTPVPNATNVTEKKVSIEFDEYIKLESASEKVIISPPQLASPEVKAVNRKVVVNFEDTLIANTTYTIDFGDAIVDNNESNPMGQFTFAFSTGEQIDTFEMSGTVLEADNLEPIKGIQVGLHRNLEDSAFTTLPFDRISRTDSRGQFTIRGIAPGKYRAYALKDGNQNYLFDSKSEYIAWMDSLVVPSCMPDVRYDTLWSAVDTTKIDTIKEIHYTHFFPDDILLRAFKEEAVTQYLSKSERKQTNQFILYFANKADTLPTLRGLNFDEKEALVVEPSLTNDTILYWVRDTVLAENDTIMFELTYLESDTLNQLVPKTDTLRMINKIPRERRLAMKEEEDKKMEKEKEKERKKKEKRGDTLQVEPEEEMQFMELKLQLSAQLDLGKNVVIQFDEPIEKIDTSLIYLANKVDTIWEYLPFIFMADSNFHRTYQILAQWKPGEEYKITIDSAAFTGIYGLHTNKTEKNFKIKTVEDYGILYLNVRGYGDNDAYVQLLNAKDAVVREQKIKDNGNCDFYFLQPSTKYYIRMFIDRNKNGKWDTGDYANKIQPEEVYYFNKVWEMKANFEFEEDWDINAVPLDKQKLDEIKTQKPDAEKKAKELNKERLKKLGRSS